VSEWEATDSVDVVNVATPALRVPVPRVVAESLKVTVPDAVEGDRVAVSVTDCPNAEGLTEEIRVVVVDA
jgi:hypothetical protein